MTPDPARIRAKYQLGLQKNSAPIVYRRITRINGPVPTENPCSTGSLLVDGATLAGVSAIDLRAASLEGFLRAGDILAIAAVAYTVTANTSAADTNAIADVAITPALAADAADGLAVAVTFVGETALNAAISNYPLRLIDGTVIQMRDLQIIIAAADLPVSPATEDEVVFNGETRKVVSAGPRYAGSTIVGWDIQTR